MSQLDFEPDYNALAKFFPAGGLKKSNPKKVRKTRSDKGVKRGPRMKLEPLELPDE